MLLEQRREQVEEILSHYPQKRAALMPLLYEAQDVYGYLTDEAIREVAAILDLDATEVYSVSEFYSLYYHKPMGQYIIRFCTDMPCALVGADYAYEQLLGVLGVKDGETTPDGLDVYGEVTQREGPVASLKVERSQVAKVLGAILDRHTIIDMSVEDPPLEQVIARVFEEARPRHEPQPS